MKPLATLACLVLLAGCSAAPAATPTPTTSPRLVAAANGCGWPALVRNGGKSITLNTQGKTESTGDALSVVSCILGGIGTPDYVVSHISATRALDGQQTDTWDGFTARWTYHPDVGMTLIIVDAQA